MTSHSWKIPILKPKPEKLLHAREIVVAPRVPSVNSSNYTGNPFTSAGDVVADCEGEINGKACGWHAMGERAAVKASYEEHRKIYHQQELGILLLNVPRQ